MPKKYPTKLTEAIRFRTTPELKKKFAEKCKERNTNMGVVLNAFISELVRLEELKFQEDKK